MKSRNGEMRWTTETRLVVHILFEEFLFLPSASKEQIFNSLFEDHIKNCGILHTFPYSTLYTQSREQWPRGSRKEVCQAWRDLHSWLRSPPGKCAKDEWTVRIRQAIRSINATSVCSVPQTGPNSRYLQQESVSRRPGQRGTRSASGRNITANHEQEDDESSGEGEELSIFAPNGRRRAASSNRISSTPSPKSQHASDLSKDAGPDRRPLSERTPVARWAPYESTRRAAVVTLPPSRHLKLDKTRVRPEQHRTHTSQAYQDLPARVAVTTRTKRKAGVQKDKVASSTRLFVRPDGIGIRIPSDKADPCRIVPPITSYNACPPLPPLLFRLWAEDPCSARDSRNGFEARAFYRANLIPADDAAPPPRFVDVTVVFNHMNRETFASPYISTSSRLIWILQLLLRKDTTNSAERPLHSTARISVIDTAALNQRPGGILYARAFHDEMKKTCGFSNGAWRYSGTYEFLVWKSVPKHAILRTFTANEIISLVRSHQDISQVLRFDVLSKTNQSLSNTKIPLLKKNNILLDDHVTAAIAKLCLFLGLDAYSRTEQLSRIVTEVVEGWCLVVQGRNDAAWYEVASLFARQICQRSAPPVCHLEQQERVKLEFLDGVAWACGEANARFKPDRIARKRRKAAAVGLESPARIVMHHLDAVKIALMSSEKAEESRLERYHRNGIKSIQGGGSLGATEHSRDELADERESSADISDDDRDDIVFETSFDEVI